MLEKILRKLPPHERRITVSTLLTSMRIVLAPIIVGSMVRGIWGIAFVLFVVAALTDVLDGALARFFNEQTFLGAALDPVADKVLIISCFATLAWVETPLLRIPQWFVWLIVAKELLLIVGVVYHYMQHNHVPIVPTFLGKMTTLVQICFILWLFACYFSGWMPIKTYYAMLAVMLIFIVASFIQYATIGISLLLKKNRY